MTSSSRSARLAVITFIALLAGSVQGAPDPRVVNVPGTDVSVRLWDDGGVPHYAISFDGKTFGAARSTSYVLRLRHGDFDPLAIAIQPPIEAGFAAGDDTNLYIVQFVTQSLEVYRDAVTRAGGTVHSFLPNHAHVVRMDAAAREIVEAMPFVRWVGAFHPAYRLEEFMLHNADGGAALFPLQRYNVSLFEPELENKAAVARRIEAIGGTVDREHAGKYLLEATLTPDQLFRIVRWDEVAYVDRWSEMEEDMNVVRDVGGADFLESTAGAWTGDGVRGEVIDSGFNLAHMDFQSRPLIQHTSVSSSSHGASTSGIVFGDGTANPSARGMLPDGQGIVADWDVVSIGTPRYDHTGELVQSPYEAVFQTASVGSARTTNYSSLSRDTDAALFDFDIVHCQSQSNAGNQNSRPQAWAKNIISVGGVFHRNTPGRDDDNWGGGGSTGPAADGRIKPDLVHFYDNILTVTSGGPTSYTSGFGGTSAATPIVCGHVGLFYDMWADGTFGNEVDANGTVFDNRAHMTTAKAMLINTASPYDWTRGGSNGDVTRFRQGWGLPDLRTMHDLRESFFIVDESDLIGNLDSIEYQVDVQQGLLAPGLRVTLVYADPPGEPFASVHRINDVDLKVTSPSGTVYWGNNGLTAGLDSLPGGTADTLNTVENVFLRPAESGTWTIEVIASEVVEDGHVETPELDVDFALVVSGVQPASGCAGDLDGSGTIDTADLIQLLAAWGGCGGCPEDLSGNGVVDFADILILLGAWGPCP